MRREIEDFFREQTSLLAAGEVELLASMFNPPLPVFYKDKLKLNARKSQILHAMKVLDQSVKDIGATRITFRILDVTRRPGTDTASTLVDFEFRTETELLRTSRVRYFFERTDDGLHIAMVEYLSAAFAAFMSEPLT